MRIHGRSARCRGALGSLAMAWVVTLVALASAALLARSLDGYVAGAQLEYKLQAQAAADGAMVVVQAAGGVPTEPVQIGNCRVEFEPAPVPGKVGMKVTVSRNGKPVLVRSFKAEPVAAGGLARVEAVR